MPEPPSDIPAAHRWFAAEFNNRAWELVEKTERSAEETIEMLHAAHAAAIHWQAVGTPVNLQRAENLLATACLKLGRHEQAIEHAERGLTLHPTKTKIVDGETERFDFLGYRFEKRRRFPRYRSISATFAGSLVGKRQR